MFSRAGKSTNTIHLAFADPDRLKNVQSRISGFMGKTMDTDFAPKAQNAADTIKQIMSPHSKSSEQEMARKIFESGLKGSGIKQNPNQSASEA